MKRDQCRAIHINDCMDDDEMAAAKALVDAAAPGEWRVRDRRVVRFNGDLVDDAASLDFIRQARALVPRLIRHAALVERELDLAHAQTQSARASLRRQHEEMSAALERAQRGERGRDYALAYIAEAAELGLMGHAALKAYVLRWVAGEDEAIASDLRGAVSRAHAQKQWHAEWNRLRAEGAKAYQRHGETSEQFKAAKAAFDAHCSAGYQANYAVDPSERERVVEPDATLRQAEPFQMSLWEMAS